MQDETLRPAARLVWVVWLLLIHLTSVMTCISPVLLAPLAKEKVKVGSLLEGQEDILLKRSRQRRGVISTINQTEVIELMVYVDKLMYDHYQQNTTHVEQHILAIMNLVCACMCMHTLVCTSHCEMHLHAVCKRKCAYVCICKVCAYVCV